MKEQLTHWMTSSIGFAKFVIGIWFLWHKSKTGTDFSDVDEAVILALFGGAVGNLVSADAKSKVTKE